MIFYSFLECINIHDRKQDKEKKTLSTRFAAFLITVNSLKFFIKYVFTFNIFI